MLHALSVEDEEEMDSLDIASDAVDSWIASGGPGKPIDVVL
jgi:hypothetical protein